MEWLLLNQQPPSSYYIPPFAVIRGCRQTTAFKFVYSRWRVEFLEKHSMLGNERLIQLFFHLPSDIISIISSSSLQKPLQVGWLHIIIRSRYATRDVVVELCNPPLQSVLSSVHVSSPYEVACISKTASEIVHLFETCLLYYVTLSIIPGLHSEASGLWTGL